MYVADDKISAAKNTFAIQINCCPIINDSRGEILNNFDGFIYGFFIEMHYFIFYIWESQKLYWQTVKRRTFWNIWTYCDRSHFKWTINYPDKSSHTYEHKWCGRIGMIFNTENTYGESNQHTMSACMCRDALWMACNLKEMSIKYPMPLPVYCGRFVKLHVK